MSNATNGPMKAAPDLHLAYAVIAAGTLVAIALVVAGLMGPRTAHLMPNPQGGMWVQKGQALYLCRASTKGAAPCVNLADGTTLSYADVAR